MTRGSSKGSTPQEDGDELFEENSEFIERQVWQTQLLTESVFPQLNNLEVSLRGAFGRASRDAPFQREVLRGQDEVDEGFALPFGPSFGIGSLGSSAVSVTFSDVQDQNIDLGVDLVLPVSVAGNNVDLKFGYNYTDKDRDTLTREFVFAGSGAFTDALSNVNNFLLFSEDIAGTSLLDAQLITNPISQDNAISELQVNAAYFGIDADIGDYVRVAAGFRYETSDQTTISFTTAQPELTLSENLLDGDFFLPSVSVTWNPVSNLQLRLAYSETITRPQFPRTDTRHLS